jgi:two-component sensor histidine kinase
VQSVSLDEYLKSLVKDIHGASGDENAGIAVSLKTEEVAAEPDKAVALGIMVTELVLNAIKHAYPDRKGPVRIELRRMQDGGTELSVADEGVGIDHQKTNGQSSGLGQTIIRAMAQKLASEVVYDRSARGTRATMVFLPHHESAVG